MVPTSDNSMPQLTIIRASNDTTFCFEPTPERSVNPSFGYRNNRDSDTLPSLIQQMLREYRRVGTSSASQLQRIGETMFGNAIPQLIGQNLKQTNRHKAVGSFFQITTNDLGTPWELAHDGDEFLCLHYAVGRQSFTVGSENNQKSPIRNWRILLIGNPKSDLPDLLHSEQEIEKINEIVEKVSQPHFITKSFFWDRATKKVILEALREEEFHLIHFSGHAAFDPQQPDQIGLVLANNERLTPDELRPYLKGHPWVFLNACNSAQGEQSSDEQESIVNASLVAALMEAGAEVVVGSLWPVFDQPAAKFAEIYYQTLLSGFSVGESVRKARLALRDSLSPDWAAYVLYGDPDKLLIKPEDYWQGHATLISIQIAPIVGNGLSLHLETTAEELEQALFKIRNSVESQHGLLLRADSTSVLALFGQRSNHVALGQIAPYYHAERALDTAALLQQSFQQSAFKLAIGVAAGNVALNQKTNSVIGQPVELSYWLSQKAQFGQILAPLELSAGYEERFTTAVWEIDKIDAFSQSESIVEVKSIVPLEVKRYSGELIGREEQLSELHSKWESAQKGLASYVAISGEIGVGKTHLLHQFRRQIASPSACLMIRCLSTQQLNGYSLLTEIIRNGLSLKPDTSLSLIYDQIIQLFQSKAPHLFSNQLSSQIAEQRATTLTHLFDGFIHGTANVSLQHRDVQMAFETFLDALIGKDRPLIVIVDDFHYVDELSIEIITKLFGKSTKRKLLWIVIYLADWSPPLTSWQPNSSLKLNYLEQEESRRLIEQQIDQSPSEELVQTITTVAKGNPLFIVELMRMLKQRRELVYREGKWHLVQPLATIKLPQNLQRVVRSRIEALKPDERDALERLAVLGIEFEFPFAQELLREKIVIDWSHALEEANFIRPKENTISYEFVHEVVRHEVIQGIQAHQLRHFHYQIASVLLAQLIRAGQTTSDSTGEVQSNRFAKLAYHQYQSIVDVVNGKEQVMSLHEIGSDYLQSVAKTLIKTGDRESQLYANRNAIKYYTQALNVFTALDSGTQTTRREMSNLSRLIGRSYMHLNNWDEALQWMEHGKNTLKLIDNIDSATLDNEDLANAALLYIHTGSVWYYKGEYPPAISECQKGLLLAEQSKTENAIAQACKVMGAIFDAQGNPAQAIAYYSRGIEICEKLSETDLLIEIQDNLSTVYYALGDWDKSFELDRKGLQYWRSVLNLQKSAISGINVGMIYLSRGEWQQAETHFKEVEDICETAQDDRYFALAKVNLGWVYLGTQQLSAAEAKFQESVALLTRAGIEDILMEALIGLCEVALANHEPSTAIDYSQQVLNFPEVMNQEKSMAWRIGGLAHLQLGNLDETKANLDASLQLAEDSELAFEIGKTQISLARYHQQIADYQGALTLIEQALQRFNPLRATPMIEVAQQLQSEIQQTLTGTAQ